MNTDIPLHCSTHCNKLNRFDYGILRITNHDIARFEYFTNSGGQGNSFHLYCYIHHIDNHFVVGDINDKPYKVFHSFEELTEWANKEFNPLPDKKTPQCRIPRLLTRKGQKNIHKSFEKLFKL